MSCKHGANDPNCSSHPDYRDPNERYNMPDTPDKKNYSVEAVERVGNHLVMKVKYPNCRQCAYEGNKVMVFLNVTELEALRWRVIDPHFRNTPIKSVTEAPSPAARYPASPEGWTDALTYARGKVK
jgi:hypothetical protein